jgi:hypothetical protein
LHLLEELAELPTRQVPELLAVLNAPRRRLVTGVASRQR